jgi:curved DNA-binding protein CbpA
MPTNDPDYYLALGVDSNADSVTIRKALVRELRKWGVRQNAPDPAESHEAQRQVQLLTEVSNVLLDPSRKATYDKHQAHPNHDEAVIERPKRNLAHSNATRFKPDSVGWQESPSKHAHDNTGAPPSPPLSKGELEILSQIELNLPDFIDVAL